VYLANRIINFREAGGIEGRLRHQWQGKEECEG